MRVQLVACAVLGSALVVAAPVRGEEHGGGSGSPLVLARQGSFFVNAQDITTDVAVALGAPAFGHISVRGMYVQYQIPAARNPHAYPVIMVHGSAHTGKTYEETPDGRMGWAEYFVRHGVSVYVVDHSGRARSGFDPTPNNRARLEGNPSLVPTLAEFTHEQAWVNFRFGPTPFTPYSNSRFPVAAADQYFAQMVPNTETSYPEGGESTVAALAALLDKVGPAVLLVHSQAGAYGLGAALARPELVKAVVSVEPRSCAVSDANVDLVFTHVKLLTMFGDFFGTNAGNWPAIMRECESTVARINAAHGTAEHVNLPERGISGNSHMMMLDLNSHQLADIILGWLEQNVPANTGH